MMQHVPETKTPVMNMSFGPTWATSIPMKGEAGRKLNNIYSCVRSHSGVGLSKSMRFPIPIRTQKDNEGIDAEDEAGHSDGNPFGLRLLREEGSHDTNGTEASKVDEGEGDEDEGLSGPKPRNPLEAEGRVVETEGLDHLRPHPPHVRLLREKHLQL